MGKRKPAASPNGSPPAGSIESWYSPLPPRAEVIRLLAKWRFPNDEAAQAVFRERPPRPLRITDEFVKLVLYWQHQKSFARLDYIQARCAEIEARPGDPRHELVEQILAEVVKLRARLERNQRADFSDLERLCSQADAIYFVPLADRALAFRGGSRPGRNSKVRRRALRDHQRYRTEAAALWERRSDWTINAVAAYLHTNPPKGAGRLSRDRIRHIVADLKPGR